MKTWNAATGELISERRGHAGPVESVVWLGKSDRLATASWDRTIKTWQADGHQEFSVLEGADRFAWSPTGDSLAVGGPRDETTKFGSVYVRDACSGQIQVEWPRAFSRGLWSLDWSPAGNRIVSADSAGTVRVWDPGTQTEQWSAAAHPGGEARSAAWRGDGRMLATCGVDRLIKLWTADTGELVRTLDGHPGKIGSVSWSPDGKRLATVDWQQNVRVWDPETGRVRLSLRLHGHEAYGASGQYSIAWSPDGHYFAAGSAEGTIVIWDAETGREVRNLQGHTSNVRCLAWHPDGRRLASGSLDRTIRVWNLDRGDELLLLPGGQQVSRIAWSNNGEQLAACGGNHIRIWNAGPP